MNNYNLFDNKSKFAKDLMLGFHTQFAENQRIREQSFLKILSFLGAIILGYAIVYHDPLSYNHCELSLVALVSMLLLFFGSLVILAISYNFRRDQIVNAKIRSYANLLGDKNIFPKSYDPRESESMKKWYNWMPDFLFVFYCIFPSSLFLLILSYSFRLEISFKNFDLLSTLTFSFGFFIYGLMIFFYNLFYKKIKKAINSNK